MSEREKSGEVKPEESRVSVAVKKWLEQQGYPLEMKVAAAFTRAGAVVTQSGYFLTPEGKGREIDVEVRYWLTIKRRALVDRQRAVGEPADASRIGRWELSRTRAPAVSRTATRSGDESTSDPFGPDSLHQHRRFRAPIRHASRHSQRSRATSACRRATSVASRMKPRSMINLISIALRRTCRLEGLHLHLVLASLHCGCPGWSQTPMRVTESRPDAAGHPGCKTSSRLIRDEGEGHRGADFAICEGEAVVAIADGVTVSVVRGEGDE